MQQAARSENNQRRGGAGRNSNMPRSNGGMDLGVEDIQGLGKGMNDYAPGCVHGL